MIGWLRICFTSAVIVPVSKASAIVELSVGILI